MKNALYSLVVICCLASCKSIPNDTYLVYSTFLNDAAGYSRALLVSKKTTVCPEDGFDFSYISNKLKGLEWDTYNNFLTNNTGSDELERLFIVKIDYLLISKEDEKKYFHNELAGYPYELYDSEGKYETFGIFRFSRIGFNRDKTQAIVYVELKHGGLFGNGTLYLYKRVGEFWKEIGDCPLWTA